MAKEASRDAGLRQLKDDIKTENYSRLYFFYGEERYLQEHYMDTLRKKLVSGPMEEFNYHRLISDNMSLETLSDAVEAMPMMAERTLVRVDDYNPFAQDQAARDALARLFSDLPDTCCLVFYYDTVPYARDGKMKKLTEAIDKHGVQVEFARQTGSALNEWVSRHFRQQGKTITPELCQYLVFLTDGDMTALHSEIGKIAAYSRVAAVTKQDIDAVVEPVLTAVLFDITDAISDKNYDRALLKLREVLRMQEDPIKLLAGIGSHFRKLLTAKTAAANGKDAASVKGLIGTNSDFYARKIGAQAAKFSEEFCRRAVVRCFETDYKMKRSVDTGERLLELLLLSLAWEEAE